MKGHRHKGRDCVRGTTTVSTFMYLHKKRLIFVPRDAATICAFTKCSTVSKILTVARGATCDLPSHTLSHIVVRLIVQTRGLIVRSRSRHLLRNIYKCERQTHPLRSRSHCDIVVRLVRLIVVVRGVADIFRDSGDNVAAVLPPWWNKIPASAGAKIRTTS